MLNGTSGTHYTPPVTRKTIRLTAIVVGSVAVGSLLVGWALGYLGFALFAVLGLVLGLVNNIVGVQAVANLASAQPSKLRFAGSVIGRLAVISVIAIGCAVLFRPAGFGVFIGLIVFQFLGLASSLPPLIKEVRRG